MTGKGGGGDEEGKERKEREGDGCSEGTGASTVGVIVIERSQKNCDRLD